MNADRPEPTELELFASQDTAKHAKYDKLVFWKRSRAENAIEQIRRLAAAEMDDDTRGRMLQDMLEQQFGLEPLTKCPGEHRAYADHCLICAPRWGLLGAKVKVR